LDDTSTLDRRGLFHLSIVYIVWGSTYLAIRVAVREGSGFPPFMMAGLRVLVASAILLGWGRLAHHRLRLQPGEALVLAATGVLLWTGGNGLVTWAEQRASSGLAALLVGTMPLWTAAYEHHLDRRPPSPILVLSLLTGFVGVGLLTAPVLRHGVIADVWAVIALLVAPASWGLGSVWIQRRRPDLSPQVASGYQQLGGGVVFAILALLLGEHLPTPAGDAWLAWGYLVIFGSVLAFTSFVTCLRLLPISVTMTYAYVNPVIAVFLGWLILGEAVNWWTFAGAALVVVGVAGVFHDRRWRRLQMKSKAEAA
jgi:drug/metabolite transporter (DMT)-like permease